MSGLRSFPLRAALVALPLLALTGRAHAYIDLAPTLAKVMIDAQRIVLVEVVSVDRDSHEATLKEVSTIKGAESDHSTKINLSWATGISSPPQMLQWAEPGARGVCFVNGNAAIFTTGQYWYAAHAMRAGSWRIGEVRPDMPLSYYGSISRLVDAMEIMLTGKDAVITVVAYGADDQGASFHLALNRAALPGLVKVQRIRARLRMPALVMAGSAEPAYYLGEGQADDSDIPALLQALKSESPSTRAEAAEDLGWVGPGAKSAGAAPLAALLKDAAPNVRFAAASALLKIDPKAAGALDVLSAGLSSKDVAQRRHATNSAGIAGPAAGPLTERLAGLLKDPDFAVRFNALHAIATLGPAAAKAAAAVAPLLDDSELAIDAADALGRIGPAASGSLKRLTKMLDSPEPTVYWAAVRGISQIGGEEARPAVDFMIKSLLNCNEIEGYNMMIYLALLGPVARDAAPTVRNARIKNPVLPVATLWAMEPDKYFPWQNGVGSFGHSGGRPNFAGDAGPDYAKYIYESYVFELGDRLRPAARALASRLLDGTAGDVPQWGYKILTCSPEAAAESVSAFKPELASDKMPQRERAAVGLGYMGPAAASARPVVEAAIAKARDEHEKRLLQWCLREMGKD
jgi:HEAT repeat protein